MRKQIITLISFFMMLSSIYSQTSEKVGTFILQRTAAELIKVVNPTYLAAYGLGQIMDKNMKTMTNHWRATREAIENTDNYTRDNRHPKKIPFSFINYEPDRLKLLKYFKNLEYYAELINKSYDKNKVNLYIKGMKKFQSEINGIFIEYRGEPYFISREEAISKIEKKNTKNETIDKIEGLWANTTHIHDGCKNKSSICKKYNVTLTFSKDKSNNLIAEWPGFSLKGKIKGTAYSFKIYNGHNLHGKGEFNFNPEFTFFTGNWNDNYGHKGTWTGSR